MIRCLALAACLILTGIASAAAAGCADQLQQDMIAARTAPPAQRTPELTLYVQFYTCLGRPAPEAQAFATLRVQLAGAAEAYIAGTLPPAAYRAFLLDRQTKAERMQRDPDYASAVGAGDADGDLVPDTLDKCPGTAPMAVTDDQGCDHRCPPAGVLVRNPDPICRAAAPPNSPEDPLRPALAAMIPVNLACEDVAPAASTPIAWGSRSKTVLSGRPVPFATVDTRSGFYVQVRRTSPQAPGCETWYAVQFVFRNPSSPGLPAIDIVSVLFSNTEDENPADPSIARFPMITNHSQLEGDVQKFSTDLPLSPGRTRLRDDLTRYGQVSIRVRVITGSQQTSPWSPFVIKPASPSIDD